jgi:hypothetical protein
MHGIRVDFDHERQKARIAAAFRDELPPSSIVGI